MLQRRPGLPLTAGNQPILVRDPSRRQAPQHGHPLRRVHAHERPHIFR